MTIADMREKCKGRFKRIPKDILIVFILLLASSASFGLGFLAGRDTGQGSDSPFELSNDPGTGSFIASKNGTRYYPPGCTAANRVTDANRVYFSSAEAARTAGYTLASGCDE